LEQIDNEYILIRIAEKLEDKESYVTIIFYRNFHSRGMLDFMANFIAKSILNYQTRRNRSNVDVVDRFHTKR